MNYLKTYEDYKSMNVVGEHLYIKFDLLDKKHKAKVDSGAETCSIHSTYQKVKDGVLTCKLLDNDEILEFKTFKKKNVKSSNGESSSRYFIKLKCTVEDTDYNIEFSLNDRNDMEYPILIGKNLLRKDFLIDIK